MDNPFPKVLVIVVAGGLFLLVFGLWVKACSSQKVTYAEVQIYNTGGQSGHSTATKSDQPERIQVVGEQNGVSNVIGAIFAIGCVIGV